MKDSLRRPVYWLIIVMTIVLVTCFVNKEFTEAREKGTLAKIISKVHSLTGTLRAYVADHGVFPESLEAMLKDSNIDNRLLLPLAGERIQYFRPSMTASGSVEVIVVTFGTNRIVVNKDFERKR